MHLRFLASAALAACISVVTPAGAFAQVTPAAQSPADQALVDSFMAAVNGTKAQRDAWLAANVSAKPRMPLGEFPEVFDSLAGARDGLKVLSWTRRPDNLRILVKAGDRWGRIDLRFGPEDPTHLDALFAVATPAAYAQPLIATPVDRATLKQAIDQRVRFAADADQFSGAVLVLRDGELIYSGAFGEADKDRHIRNILETRFNLGSMDKQFTAVAIGQLIEQGKLTLDSRLIDVLPDYPNQKAARKITIRQLLSHQAGLGMLFERKGWDWRREWGSHAEMLQLFADAPSEFEPGQRTAYSNEGFTVLGAVIEKVSGRSWYDYVAANIFGPAGMTHTFYPRVDERPADRAVGYAFPWSDPLGLRGREANWAMATRGNSCGGGFSTAGDMIRFLQALKAGKLLKPATLTLFTTHPDGGLANYGLGFKLVSATAGRGIVGHDGGGPHSGVNSDAKMVWETGYAYAVLGNYDSPFAQTLGRDIGEMLAAQN
ncbi:MAG: beta-lactamase family protein [Alphaproteobacteria bacterium]|nr:beta-lactamase family protein [Alphaproteobacteria bacterium]MBU1514103.1 beta-lactamase family protein [Alphaproteobacteria bacterium]MBU2096248.1 beta-lactamase family protein [Alphaproteobacteria bacterium]MBU2151202.1 beta-lactamase family protein [Alphaproteobacteria bacterium]MBU2307139.1 beta-lactamase family protein [Alphaproteobacteria bacterium]